MPDARITLRRKSPYCTKSNKFKKVRTPGGKLKIQYTKKLPTVPKCGDTGATLFGVAVARPKELMRKSKRMKSVSRCYGGVLSGKAVRSRIIRAFLLEEQKIVKKVVRQKKQEAHQAEQVEKKKKSKPKKEKK